MRKRSLLIFLIFSLAILLCLTDYSFSQKRLKVFISVDMEGIAGVVHGDHTSSSGRDYSRARRWATEEVNAAIKGALEAGATEVVVNDSHGSMRNIIASELNPAALLITGSPKPLSMMQGIDQSFDAAIFIGYHARAGTQDGVLDHTYSGGSIYSVKVNKKEMSEADLNALIAGWHDVPVVLISGDFAICEQTKESLGEELEIAVVKRAVGRYAAKSYTPQKAQEIIYEKTKIALAKKKKPKPFKMKSPYRFEVNFLRSSMADGAELIPQVERTGPRSVRFVTDDYIEGFKLLRAIIILAR